MSLTLLQKKDLRAARMIKRPTGFDHLLQSSIPPFNYAIRPNFFQRREREGVMRPRPFPGLNWKGYAEKSKWVIDTGFPYDDPGKGVEAHSHIKKPRPLDGAFLFLAGAIP